MRLISRRAPALLAAAAGIACASAPRSSSAPDAEAEARAVMAGIARDLNAGDREGMIARYDERGSFALGGGDKQYLTPGSLAAIYRGPGWSPPAKFEWHDLSYDVLSPDVVVVAGRFDWTERSGRLLPFSNTGVLVRRQGRLRLRLEHEDVAPSSLKPDLCAPDSTRR
jgi:hypothetical protein